MIFSKKAFSTTSIALLLLLVFNITGFSQSVPYLNIPTDPVALGMGGTSLTVKESQFSIYNNPAFMTAGVSRTVFGASYIMWQPKSTNNQLLTISGFTKLGKKLAVGVGFRNFTSPSYEITDNNGNVTGRFTPKDMAIDMGLSYLITPKISVGISGKYISSDLGGPKKGSSIAGSLSLLYKVVDNVNLGLAVNNIGGKINYGYSDYNLPMNIAIGGSYSYYLSPLSSLSANLECNYLLYEKAFSAGLGVQYTYKNMLSVFGGYHYGDPSKAIPSYASIGISAKFSVVKISAAYLLTGSNSPLKNTLGISLGFLF